MEKCIGMDWAWNTQNRRMKSNIEMIFIVSKIIINIYRYIDYSLTRFQWRFLQAHYNTLSLGIRFLALTLSSQPLRSRLACINRSRLVSRLDCLDTHSHISLTGFRSPIRKMMLPSSDVCNFLRSQRQTTDAHENDVHSTNCIPGLQLERNETDIENSHLSQRPHMRNAA